MKKVRTEASERIRKQEVAWRIRGINFTEQRYQDLWIDQKGLCAICGGRAGQYRLHLDHDHDTKRVRGLLCVKCNIKLEWVEKNYESIVEYLGLK